MRRIDEQHPECPFAGARMLSMILTREGRTVGLTLMKRIGLHASDRKPNISKRQLARQVYPYLLCHLEITQSNHVWAADITYIPMTRGLYNSAQS